MADALSDAELIAALMARGKFVVREKELPHPTPTSVPHSLVTTPLTPTTVPVTPKLVPPKPNPPVLSISTSATVTPGLTDVKGKTFRDLVRGDAGLGARPKQTLRASTPLLQGTSALFDDSGSAGQQNATQFVSTPVVTKIPSFSGDDQKGDVTYTEWRFEVRCLLRDTEVSASMVVQAIHRSLRGTAPRILVSHWRISFG